MTTYHLYTGADGETHLDERAIPLADYEPSRLRPRHSQSEPMPATWCVFCRFPPGTAGDWHTAPRRQVLILNSGEMQITPSAGESHTLRAGDAVLIEDTTGKGHLTRSPSGAEGVFVHLGEPSAS